MMLVIGLAIAVCVVILFVIYVVVVESSYSGFNSAVDTDVDVYERVEARIARRRYNELVASGLDADSARAMVHERYPDVPSSEIYIDRMIEDRRDTNEKKDI